MMIGTHNTNERVFIIAEVGNNHEGNYALAEKLVYLAKEAGADAVKFQTFKTEQYVTHKNTARFERLKSFELSYDEFEKLSQVAKNAGLIFISTPFDLASAAFLSKIVAAFKIASGDNMFYPLIEAVAKTRKPMIVSGGMADISQLQFTQDFIYRVWQENKIAQELAMLHCVASYPVSPEQANIGAVAHMRRALKCTVGYSDHTAGIEAAAAAVALGARIIEKHFTIDKHYSDFRDHQLSADPAEMTDLVKRIRTIETLLGSGVKAPQECEKEMMIALRRSIVSARDLAEGAVIGLGDITWVRPAGGLPPGAEKELLGKRLRQSVPMGEMLTAEMVQ